ncbi:hypothetical protein TW65_07494 [Stemphylium lycopersici]|uniref:FAD binding domain-containing protein n=1 Tax=Stemphylium lycopersici TaxID=183478 RepID=A0A364NDC0_STELY|nr:hypothetical protein TW65_07494 [Stemphylium lycopersici]RAR15305.1 FAD binding domain-containing protein [Stemphylium lycopersici]
MAIKGGGHSIMGASSTNSGLLIDLTTYKRTTDVKVEAKTITFPNETPDAVGSWIISKLLKATKMVEVTNSDMAVANRKLHFNVAIVPIWWDEKNDDKCGQW